jgi:hypothetical protein
MTNPSIRDLFMGARNLLRMEEALLSLLAGDLFRSTPIQWSLGVFKCVYYLNNLANPWRTFNAWRGRRRAIRERRASLRHTREPRRWSRISPLRWKTFPCVVLIVFMMAVTPLAGAAELPLWEVGAGVAVIDFPDYRGADERRVLVLPFPYVVYRGELLQADREGLRGGSSGTTGNLHLA